MAALFGELYEIGHYDRETFGDHWCGPDSFEHGQETLVATYEPTNTDGEAVKVYCVAMPARFYVIKGDSFELSFGSGTQNLAAQVAGAIADGMLRIKTDR